ncbi:MAG: hypothetical protein LBL71_03670 [Endomicrobium sp.]|jgi:hypothetical protein|nr:hypothetical protein [Endomicrobium sp.]
MANLDEETEIPKIDESNQEDGPPANEYTTGDPERVKREEDRKDKALSHFHNVENWITIAGFIFVSLFGLGQFLIAFFKGEPNAMKNSFFYTSNSAFMLILGYLFGKRDSKN